MIKFAGAILCLILVFNAAIGQAQESILVRSGEHDAFSRLVFGSEQVSNWSLDQRSGGYVLKFTGVNPSFDIRQIYNFIPKTRLLAITALAKPETGFFLDIATDHFAEAFETQSGLLVVDIKFGQRPITPVENTAAISTSETSVIDPQMYILQPPTLQSEAKLRRRDGGLELGTSDKKLNHPSTRKPTIRLPQIEILEAQQRLEDALETARRQGLVLGDVKIVEPNETNTAQSNIEGKTLSEPAPPRLPEEGNLLDHLNLDAQTVFDRDRPKPDRQLDSEYLQLICLDDSLFDVENWVGSDPVERISELRRKLTGEFDRVDRAVLEDLVKLYVFFGFGTEARAMMASYDGVLENQRLLVEMSHLIEAGPSRSPSVLADQRDCNGRSALWAVLAVDAIPIGEDPDAQNLADVFAKMPAGLRQRIGPRLGGILVDAGFFAAAEGIVKLVSRASGTESPAFDLLIARLALKRGKTATAEKILRKLVLSSAPNASESLLYLVNSLIERAEPIPDDLILELGAYAFEWRASPLGSELIRLQIRALARQQKQTQSFDILTHEAILETIDPDTTSEIASQIFLSFDIQGSNLNNLVETYFSNRNLLARDASMDAARSHLARGLLSAGLPSVAQELMAVSQKRHSSADVLLVGEIYLVLGQLNSVLDLLATRDDASARALKVQTLAQKREYATAFETADEMTAPELKDDLAWRASRWKDIANSNIPSRRSAFQFNDGRKRPPAKPEEDLTELAGKVQESSIARSEIDQLLKEHPLP